MSTKHPEKSSVTISGAGKSVTLSGGQLSELAKKLSGDTSKIDAIAEVASEQLNYLLHESAEEIRLAMLKCVEECALQEKEAVFNLGFTVSLNLDQNKQIHKLAWATRTTRETETEIPDPNQEKLNL